MRGNGRERYPLIRMRRCGMWSMIKSGHFGKIGKIFFVDEKRNLDVNKTFFIKKSRI